MKLHEHAWGPEDAPQVVCAHGVTGHGLRFRRLGEELSGSFRVRSLDLRGHGRSGWDEPWTIEAHVDDLAETAGGPADWIGHSFGGRLVVELTARRPELVRRAVLLDPALWVPPDFAAARAEEQLAGPSFAQPRGGARGARDAGPGSAGSPTRRARRWRRRSRSTWSSRRTAAGATATRRRRSRRRGTGWRPSRPPSTACACRPCSCSGAGRSSSAAASSRPIVPRSATCSRSWSSRAATSSSGTPTTRRRSAVAAFLS